MADSNFILLVLSMVALTFSPVSFAVDPSSLQDFCVADVAGTLNVNGFSCKDPTTVTADDFFFSGLHKPGNTTNAMGYKVTPVFAAELPGLNTLGIALARIDYAPWGLNPPHLHQRATEILVVLEGTLEVGFVATSSGNNKLFNKILQKGDVFVFPVGLVHYQRNVGYKHAVVLAGLSSQNPGVIPVAAAIFGSVPPIRDDVLAKAFQVDKSTVSSIRSKF